MGQEIALGMEVRMNKVMMILATLAALAGCAPESVIGANDSLSGMTAAIPEGDAATGAVHVVWSVTSGSPDYMYGSGSGTYSDTGFELELPESLPAEATNNGIGVGVIVALDASVTFPEGRIDSEAEFPFHGATPRHAIIYRAPGVSVEGLGWASDFPEGFSCGVGVDAPEDSTFDTFAPIACDLIELRIGNVEEMDFVNWT